MNNNEFQAINWVKEKIFDDHIVYENIYRKPYSSLFKIKNNSDLFILKLNTLNLNYEQDIIYYLSHIVPHHMLEVVAINKLNNCFITKYFDSINSDEYFKNILDIELLNKIVLTYCELQQIVKIEDLKNLKIRDISSKNLLNYFFEQIKISNYNKYYYRLLSIKQKISSDIEILINYGIKDSLEHGDFHLGNILINKNKEFVFIDFAEATIANPLFSLISFIFSLNRRLNIDLNNPIIKTIEDIYLNSYAKFLNISISEIHKCYTLSKKLFDIYYVITTIQLIETEPSNKKWDDRIHFHINQILSSWNICN